MLKVGQNKIRIGFLFNLFETVIGYIADLEELYILERINKLAIEKRTLVLVMVSLNGRKQSKPTRMHNSSRICYNSGHSVIFWAY